MSWDGVRFCEEEFNLHLILRKVQPKIVSERLGHSSITLP